MRDTFFKHGVFVMLIPRSQFCSFLKLLRCVQANAQEKFMRIKHAYNTLINSDSRSRYDAGNRKSDFSYSSSGRNQSTQEEEFYGFGTSS